jgi:hypothetical protein
MKKQKHGLDYLFERSEFIIDFIIDSYRLEGSDSAFLSMKKILIDTFNKKDIKGLRMLAQDIDGFGKELPYQKDVKLLNRALVVKFGEDLYGNRETLSVVNNIITSGKISDEDEHRVLHDFLFDVDEQKITQINREKLLKILDDFESSNKEM